MSNALGTIVPVKEVVKLAHARGIPVLVDGSQAAVHLAIDVQDIDCDFYVFTGHKLYADIQRSLLPKTIPTIPGLGLAAHYQTSQWAGGDYYDFFPLTDGRWGIMIADVSGHGTPAAVMMAITHSIAHAYPGPPDPPAAMLEHVNQRARDPLHGRQRARS